MEKINYEVLYIIEMIDFADCKLSPRNLKYGGRAGEKKGYLKTFAIRFDSLKN